MTDRRTLFRNVRDYGYGAVYWDWRPWVRWTFAVLTVTLVVGGTWWWTAVTDRAQCNAPYHLVYAGTQVELVGKILMPVDQYDCVAN